MSDARGEPPVPSLSRATRQATPESVFESLDLAVRRHLPGRLQGDRRGLRLGPGSEPEEVVRYRPGEDDVRRIDWNVTARAGAPHVWRPLAEHELESWVLVDDSPSMAFGTVELEKRDLAAGAAAAIGLLTQGPGNRVGVGTITGDGLHWSAPFPSRAAAQRALRERRRETDTPTAAPGSAPELAEAVKALGARYRRPGLRVVVSDFVEPDGRSERPFAWERPLRRLAGANETIVVEVVDPRELALPDIGTVTLEDPETGQRREVWTSDRRLREKYAETAAAHRSAVAEAVRGARAAHIVLRTDRDWVRDLARHVLGQRTVGRRSPGHSRPGARSSPGPKEMTA